MVSPVIIFGLTDGDRGVRVSPCCSIASLLFLAEKSRKKKKKAVDDYDPMAMLKLQKKLSREADIRRQIKELKKQQDQMEERERKREAERRKEKVVASFGLENSSEPVSYLPLSNSEQTL